MKKVPLQFFEQEDVCQIAKEMLGMIVETRIGGMITSGRIVETEAYAGQGDKASHAYGNRRTKRNEPMYQRGGTIYVYTCYGLHQLLNIVSNKLHIPHAILVRGIEPLNGMQEMIARTQKKAGDFSITRGPGNLAKALGISTLHSGKLLNKNEIYIYRDVPSAIDKENIGISKRIGVQYAGEDANLLYRFYERGNPFVSAKPNK